MNSLMHILSYLISFAILMPTWSAQNNTIVVDWKDSTYTCADKILDQVKINNSNNQNNLGFTTDHVCKTDGSLLRINDCNNEIQQSVEILTYFFSTPENNPARQCICQSKCTNLPQSYYTMKFLTGSQINYFTTSNPCVAFCNKGYEIYLSSYAVNSYPTFNGVSSIVKSFDSGCYNRLDDSNQKIRQLSLMKIELCKARIICNLLVKKFLDDITNVELAIYGRILEDDHIMTDQEKYWVKTIDSSKPCVDLIDSAKNAFCITQYSTDSNFHCFIDEIEFLGGNNEIRGIKYVGTTLKLYKCVEGTLFDLGPEVANTGECLCNIYSEQFLFSSDLLEEAYGGSNEKFIKFTTKNYFYSNSSIDLNYLKEDYSYGYCKCNTFEGTYDYFCLNPIYASCIIDNSTAVSKKFMSDEEKNDYFKSIISNTPDMILGFKEDECLNLNTICSDVKNSDQKCIYKKNTGFQYPTFKISNDFIECADDYFVNQGNDSLNYRFECPQGQICDIDHCSAEMFLSCNSSNLDNTREDFCSRYDFACAQNCQQDSEKMCIEENSSSIFLLASKYEICIRDCLGISVNILCSSNNSTNCEVSECKTAICNDCRESGSQNCPSFCNCSFNDHSCICLNQTCSNKNATDQTYCYFSDNTLPSKVSENKKCFDVCAGNSTENRYIFCADCQVDDSSCCDVLCDSHDDVGQTECILVEQTYRLISQRRKCTNKCQKIIFTEVNLENCNIPQSCEENCETLDKIVKNDCYFDESNSKICFSSYDMCLNSCSNQIYSSVNCNNTDDYTCFLKYCFKCHDLKAIDSNVECQKECGCRNQSLLSIEECKCFSNNCIDKTDSAVKICHEKNNNYDLLTELEFCTRQCQNMDIGSRYECNSCNSDIDCCINSCPSSVEPKCIYYNGVYLNSTDNEICRKSCSSISYEVVDEHHCCLSACQPSSLNICLKENSEYYITSRNEFCHKICVDKNSNVAVVNETFCCKEKCLYESEETYCIKTNEVFEYSKKEVYCDRKCNGDPTLVLGDDSLCCEHSCYLEQSKFLSGSYCDESFNIYSSYWSYCTSKKCKNLQNDIVFCSNSSTCSVETCKKQIAISKCSNLVGNRSISINTNGRCTFYDNVCYARVFSKQGESIFTCPTSNTNDCINDPNLYLKYSSVYQSTTGKKFCRKGELLTSRQKTFYDKCLEKSEEEISECTGSKCDQAFCKAKNCKEKCSSTEFLYWGSDCKIYESKCELDCMGVQYFEFFDIIKLLSVCRNNSNLPSNYLDIILLKKNVCLQSGVVKAFSVFIPWIWKLYTDCYRLKSLDINDCDLKCKKWAKNLK